MGAGEAFGAVDGELVDGVGGDGGVFGGEGDVEAADAEVGVLHVEVVGVAHGTVLEDGDADAACGRRFPSLVFLFCFFDFVLLKGLSGTITTHCSSID